jgi:hypothetical protein
MHAAFKSKKFGKTQLLPKTQTNVDLSSKSQKCGTALNSTDTNIDSDKVNKTDEKSTSLSHSKRGKRLNSFKKMNYETSNTQFNVFKDDTISDVETTNNITTVSDVSNTRYKRNHRQSKAYFICPTMKKAKSYKLGKSYKSSNYDKPPIPCTQENSPSNVSKKMRQFNNEKYGSKKFFKGIDSSHNYNSNYEIMQKQKFDAAKGEKDHYILAAKENINLTKLSACEVATDTKNDYRKPPKETKKRLKRGMTVKFQGDEDILSLVEKNNEMVRSY